MGEVRLLSLVERVRAFIQENSLLAPGDRVLAAVSGGPDSVCLARILDLLARQPGLPFPWGIVHVNHHLRGEESDRDQAFCKDLAKTLGVDCLVKNAHVGEIRKRSGGSIESVGRQERYRLLCEAAREFSASKVALGHHADDNVETILYHVFRGAGLRGLAGIPHRRPLSTSPPVEIIRPLLGCGRADLLAVLEALGQEYCTDTSNLSAQPRRNWIRLHLLPELEKVLGPGISGSVLRLGAHASEAHDLVRRQAEKFLGELAEFPDRHTACLEGRQFIELHPTLKVAVLEGLVQRLGGLEQGLLAKHFSSISILVENGYGEIHLPHGFRASMESGILYLNAPELGAKKSPESIPLPIPGQISIPEESTLSAKLCPGPAPSIEEMRQASPAIAYLNWDSISPPLQVRLVRPGDRMQPLGMKERQKLQDILVNEKIPRRERRRVYLVVDQRQILWVVGLRIADPAKVTDSTRKFLELRFDRRGPKRVASHGYRAPNVSEGL